MGVASVAALVARLVCQTFGVLTMVAYATIQLVPAGELKGHSVSYIC